MLTAKSLNLNGLVIDGAEPITPRTREFLISKRINVEQKAGFVIVNGNFSVSKVEIDQFLASKKSTLTPKP